ncbi:hypothetical protein GCM10010350_27850 [Streptomyces galilaeus]|nr:hypothetical protein GCM10010350_27850 [Streptomyces galilaeus]
MTASSSARPAASTARVWLAARRCQVVLIAFFSEVGPTRNSVADARRGAAEDGTAARSGRAVSGASRFLRVGTAVRGHRDGRGP